MLKENSSNHVAQMKNSNSVLPSYGRTFSWSVRGGGVSNACTTSQQPVKHAWRSRVSIGVIPFLLASLTIVPSFQCLSASGAAPGAAVASRSTSATGLDSRTLKLINKGDWTAACQRLTNLTASETVPGKLDEWLAFAYMFQNKRAECNALAEKFSGYKGSAAGEIAAQVVHSLSLIASGQLDEADKLLQKLPPDSDSDVVVNLVRAAVLGKQGQAAAAVNYCRKVVGLAPDLGWVYRTAGFIEDRWLKDAAAAAADYEKALVIDPDFQEARDLLVDLCLVANNFDAAVDTASAGIKCAPRDAKSYYRLSQVYTQQWRLREALQQLQKAISLKPDEARYHRTKATILRYQGQLGQAIAEQQVAVDLSKDKAFELVEMASLNIMAGNSNRAAESLRDALRLDAGNSAAHQRLVQILEQEKRYGDLVEEYKRVLTLRPKEARLYLGLARALVLNNKVDAALDEFKEAANLDAKDAVPHREIGAILIGRKDFSAAAREYTRALNINPNSVEDLVALGFCYAQAEEYLPAEAALVTAIALQQLSGSGTNQLDLMRSLAVLLLEEGRYADAASQLEAVCASSKTAANNPYDQFLLARAKALRDRTNAGSLELAAAYEKLPEEKKKAEKYALLDGLVVIGQADKALDLETKLSTNVDNSDSQRLVFRSRAWQTKGGLDKALEFASQAVAVQNKDNDKASDAELQFAHVLAAKGDRSGAEQAINKTLELNPKSFLAYVLSGRLAIGKADYLQAIAAGKKALEINPYCAGAYLLLGDAQGASDSWKTATGSYRKAVELYPGLLEAHKALLNAYKKQSLKAEAKMEEEQINQIEKRN